MRLLKIQAWLKANNITYSYSENDDCGGIEFTVRGLAYHIWEYPEPERGAASNLRGFGRMEDFEGDYEDQLVAILKREECFHG